MNRTKARARIEQILEWRTAMIVDGRCPKCEAIGQVGGAAPMPGTPLSAADQRDVLEQHPLHEFRFNHREGCPMIRGPHEASRLLDRFGWSLEHVVIQAKRGPVLVTKLITGETEDQ